MREGWTYKKLGEICEIERGGSPRPIQQYITDDEDGLNWIKIGDAVEGSKYINSTKEKIRKEGLKKTRFVHKGDFILSNSMSFGKPYILGIDGCIHDGWLVIRDTHNHFDKSFLYYLLGSPNMYNEFKRLAVGGVVNNLNSQLVRNVFVPVPPLSEQQRIVSELDLLSSIIDKKKAQLKEYDQLAQSIFYDMFGDPVTNEKGWEVMRLGDEFEVSSGGTPSTKKSEYWDDGNISWIGSNMCQNQIIFENDGKYITKEGFEHSSAKLYKKGFVLIALVGATIGKVALLNFATTTNQNIAGVNVPSNKDFDPMFVFYLIQSMYCFFENIGDGKFKMANLSFVRSLPIIKPSYEIQQSFTSKIEVIERQKALVRQSITEAETLFNSRMDYYFN